MKKILLLTLILVFICPVNAFIDVSLDSESFGLGDEIVLVFNLYSFNEDVSLKYDVTVDCPQLPTAMLVDEVSVVELVANVSSKVNYSYYNVIEDTEPQVCKAFFNLVEPNKYTVTREFEIITDPSFDFNIKLCTSESCEVESKSHLKGGEVYFDYFAMVSEPLITASLTYPDSSIKSITLPSSINAKQLGTYTLKVTASKDGFKTVTDEEQFVISDRLPNIGLVEKRDEHVVNASDLPSIPSLEDQLYKTNYLLTALLSIILVLAVIFLLNFVLRLKEGERSVILKLENYILNAKSQGYSNFSIKRVLKRSGWKMEEIDRAFSLIKK
ncbi:hypothetical protein HN592_01905 [Candidatus Woesearchaeota archaeon]|nr:hypothetical protein [Candidatus Woesearchaeota archaeon]MBT4368563.1 hypothetical protein [Candidatus Woesearchaeota archaeon]MBT4713128.1 hypothetical protein [Candidatus Woesearchaeota archaeon]MBT6639050.1 hypothetical protein [Candidatus Woesearchaeota archaeon]MBT7134249.1 hypothetical protein [Candidatus Woesearchaeota archaeon]